MKSVTFECCKFLNHNENNYIGCKLKSLNGMGVYFERGESWTEGGNPKDVQFCSKRGRLNYKSACLWGCAVCSDYENELRTVEIEE